MAKKRVAAAEAPAKAKPTQKIFEGEGFPQPPPKDVQKAVDAYVEAKRAKGDALAILNTARDNVIAKMIEHGITMVKIDEGDKVLELDTTQAVKIKKAKKPGESDDDEGSDDE